MTEAESMGDGRQRRKARTRSKAINACRILMKLWFEGEERCPTVVAVAKLSGVSARSVFQHFASLDGLMDATATAHPSLWMEFMNHLKRHPNEDAIRMLQKLVRTGEEVPSSSP